MNEAYPSKPVRVVVPLPQGGPADILARTIAEKLLVRWKQQVTVENAVGGDTIDGTLMVAKAPPDGHTLLVVPSQFTVHPRQRSDMPYDVIQDFTPVILMALGPNVLVVHDGVPVSSLQELIALGKSKLKILSYATGGPGSTSHVAAEKFRTVTGLDLRPVHFKGAAPATDAILAGETDMLFSVMAPTIPYVQSGKLKALAVTGPNRSRALPQVPTLRESGVPIEITTWQGMLAPSGTAREIVLKLNADIAQILREPDIQQKLAARGFEVTGSTPEEFAARIREEITSSQ